MKEKTEEKTHIHIDEKLKQEEKEHQYSSPPDSSSSPSHEFSFTMSFHSSAPPTIFPADDVFSHGHMLPLHHHQLPHPPVSPRSSTANSLDSFSLPVRELSENRHPCNINNASNNNNYHRQIQSNDGDHIKQQQGSKHNNKSKSFSLFGIPKWRNNKCEEESDHGREKEEYKKKKYRSRLSFKISHVVSKYMRMVIIPFLSSGRSSRSRNIMQQFRNESNNYSFSGHISLRNINNQDLRGRRREFSAPASIRTSPTNSGALATAESVYACSSSDHSTMEDLQDAIQAAIAHCKNSVITADKLKRQDQPTRQGC